MTQPSAGPSGRAFYIYDRDIFGRGPSFYEPGAAAMFGRVDDGRVEFCHAIRINNYGCVDDVPYRERDGRPQLRIVAVGDSFTANLDSAQHWPALLEERLRWVCAAPVQVFNLGLTGAGPSNWMALAGLVGRLQPDVLVMTCYDGILRRPRIRFVTRPGPRRFECHYGHPMFSTKTVGVCDPRFPNLSAEALRDYGHMLDEEQRRHRRTLLGRLRSSLCHRSGHAGTLVRYNQRAVGRMLEWAPSVIIALAPSLRTLNEGGAADPQRAFLIQAAAARRVTVVDLARSLQGSDAQCAYTASSHHWNAVGNAIVAQALVEPVLDAVRGVEVRVTA